MREINGYLITTGYTWDMKYYFEALDDNGDTVATAETIEELKKKLDKIQK